MMKKTFAFAAPGPEGQPPAPGPQMDQKAPPAPKAQPKHLKKAPHRAALRHAKKAPKPMPARSPLRLR